ncbi:MAG TPA: Na/Pi cotransporter family protein, partial [Candidatus Methylacidiphilales bacterium]|nr:Na/Pi cotransporter family protein [Candidatus Methylacidiphilales bacterium]
SVQMLNTGQLTTERMLAILLGANVGMTVMLQLIAFRIQDFAPLFLVAGVIGFQFLGRNILRGIGQCLLALGFVFLAMDLIGRGSAGIAAAPETRQWVSLLESHSWLILVTTACSAVVFQSSTATVGLAMGLAGDNIITMPIVLPWVIGTNIGIAITSIIAGWNNLEGKRLGVASLISKAALGVPLMLVPAAITTAWLGELPGDLPRQIVLFHTGFNLVVGILSLPFLTPLTRLVNLMIVPENAGTNGANGRSTHLDANALDTPPLALAYATRETLRMADATQHMLQQFWVAFKSRDADLAQKVQQSDDPVDSLNRDITDYLSKISDGMTEQEARWQFTLLTFTNELEAVGDIIDKNLCDALQKQIAEGVTMIGHDRNALATLYEKVEQRLEMAIGLLMTRDAAQAKAFLAGKEPLNDWCRQAQKEHYDRLRTGDRQAMACSTFFLDMLNSMKKINSHVSSLAYSFHNPPAARARRQPAAGKAPVSSSVTAKTESPDPQQDTGEAAGAEHPS